MLCSDFQHFCGKVRQLNCQILSQYIYVLLKLNPRYDNSNVSVPTRTLCIFRKYFSMYSLFVSSHFLLLCQPVFPEPLIFETVILKNSKLYMIFIHAYILRNSKLYMILSMCIYSKSPSWAWFYQCALKFSSDME